MRNSPMQRSSWTAKFKAWNKQVSTLPNQQAIFCSFVITWYRCSEQFLMFDLSPVAASRRTLRVFMDLHHVYVAAPAEKASLPHMITVALLLQSSTWLDLKCCIEHMMGLKKAEFVSIEENVSVGKENDLFSLFAFAMHFMHDTPDFISSGCIMTKFLASLGQAVHSRQDHSSKNEGTERHGTRILSQSWPMPTWCRALPQPEAGHYVAGWLQRLLGLYPFHSIRLARCSTSGVCPMIRRPLTAD